MVDNTFPVSTAPNTAEQAAAMNAAYIAGVAYVPGNFVSPQQDAANEAAKQQAAFSQPRNDSTQPRSAAFEQIQQQYAQQQNRVVTGGGVSFQGAPTPVNPYRADTAAGIAWEVGRTGGAVDIGVAQKAIAEGAKPSEVFVATSSYLQRPSFPATATQPAVSLVPIRENIAVSELGFRPDVSIESGIQTVPRVYTPSFQDRIIGEKTVAGTFGTGGVTDVYVPYGSYAQTKIENAKLAVDPLTGEIAIYQKNYHGTWGLIGGGGRNAAQSGMFSVGKALTPYVSSQEGVGSYVRPSGEGLSKLGAEAYGGMVSPLDSRVLAPGTAISRYADASNIANLAVQIPAGKAEVAGAKIPWSISEGAPAISAMSYAGIGGAISSRGLGVTKVELPSQVKGVGADVSVTGLPAPFISSVGGAQPTKYEYRTDPLAVTLEGALYFGDMLTLGLWTPGKELLASKGQGDNPTLAAADATLAQFKARQPEIAALGTSIETQRATIDAMLVGKTNAEGKFIGTAGEYTKYTGALTKLNEDVATYNKFNTDYSNAWGKAVASGAYIKTDKGYVANPDLEHPYGAFSDWSRSLTQSLRGGVTEADIIRYESSPAYKESGFAMQFGESSWKAITNPTELSTMALHGVEFYAGIGALGAGVGMIAAPAAAEGGVGAGVLSRGALGLQTIFQNPYVQGGIATAFTAQAYYEGTEKLTNLPAAGGTTINMAAMLAGGFAPEGAAILGDYSAVRFAIKPETQIRVQPIESGSVMPSESGASGIINFEAPYQISQLPRYNVLGYEVMFPRLSNLREVETGTIRSTQPIEIENLQSFVVERNLGAFPAAQIWSRESNIVIDFFRGRPLGRVTTETNIGALSTTRAASVFYDEAILQSRGLGRTSQEIQNIATDLALRDLEIAEPITAYRNYGTYVARGESLPNLINEALTVRITPDATATQYTVGRTNPFDYITRVSASRVGTNARENYNTWVERLPGGADTGLLSTTMTRERAIVNDLFRESTGTVPRTTEFITVYDRYGNPVFREEGIENFVSADAARNIADYMISQGGEASIAHYHPNVGFSFRELGTSISRDIWDRLILERGLLEPTYTEAYIRSKRSGSMYYETPSEGDIATAIGNPEGVAAEFIANRQGVFMYGKPQSGWRSLSGLEGMRDDALARYYFGGERGPLTNLGYDLISGLQAEARVEYTPHRQVYFEGELTTTIPEDVSGAIRGNLPSFMQRGISEAMDRIALNDQRLEFETTNLYQPVRQYAGYGGGLQYGAAQIAISGREAAVGVTTEKVGSLQGDILNAGKETKVGSTLKAYDIGSDIRPLETSRGSSFGMPIVGAPASIQTSRQVIGVVPALATEVLRAYSLGSDVQSRFDVAQKTDRLMAYTLISPQVSTRIRQDTSYDRILESASKFDMITVPKQRQSFVQEITPIQYQKQPHNPWIGEPYKKPYQEIPPPPIPPINWGASGGGFPVGSKKRRRGLKTEYFTYAPANLEILGIKPQESKKFYRAVGAGKIANAAPSGEITIVNHKKKNNPWRV